MNKSFLKKKIIILNNYKRKKYCLGICVLNEGSKIKNQIKKIKKHNFQDLDIIICDGGSDDNSINIKFLKKNKIKELLIKNANGHLSYQIMLILEHAIQKNYKGLILMDGNDKDSVKEIPEFIDAMEDGYDYIHGSRYSNGGKEINTPFLRKYLTKYIHPFIFNFSRYFRFTDTANQYMSMKRNFMIAYKKRLLRKCFNYYNLLYFLMRLAILKKSNIKEIGVTRKYKKIHVTNKSHTSGMGYFIVLKDLLLTRFGYYD